jgi:hypothetical protein
MILLFGDRMKRVAMQFFIEMKEIVKFQELFLFLLKNKLMTENALF